MMVFPISFDSATPALPMPDTSGLAPLELPAVFFEKTVPQQSEQTVAPKQMPSDDAIRRFQAAMSSPSQAMGTVPTAPKQIIPTVPQATTETVHTAPTGTLPTMVKFAAKNSIDETLRTLWTPPEKLVTGPVPMVSPATKGSVPAAPTRPAPASC